MTIWEIIAGAALLLCGVSIIFFVLIQNNNGSGLSGAISGNDIGGMLMTREGTRNEKLAKLTKILAIVFFAITLAVDIVSILAK